MNSQGRLVVVSAPSGAGKTTLVRHLLSNPELNLSFSVSATSRPRRDNEVDGKDYHFISAEDFKERVSRGDFLEWEEVYPGRYYGTLRSEVERTLAKGKNVIFDVDVVGGLNIKKHFGHRCLAIFISPPSMDILRERLRSRGTDDAQSLSARFGKAEYEMGFKDQFDLVIVNDQLSRACFEIEQAVSAFLLT